MGWVSAGVDPGTTEAFRASVFIRARDFVTGRKTIPPFSVIRSTTMNRDLETTGTTYELWSTSPKQVRALSSSSETIGVRRTIKDANLLAVNLNIDSED